MPRAANRRSPTSRAPSRRWRRSSTSPSSRCRSCRGRRTSAPATIARSSPTCASRAPSSRTPTWCASSTVPRCTTARPTKTGTTSRAWPSCSSASSETARPVSCRCTSSANSPASTTAPCGIRRPRRAVAKARSVFRCTECGAEQPKWAGRCDACGEWNTLVEEAVGRTTRRMGGSAARRIDNLSAHPPIRLSAVEGMGVGRWRTGLAEFDFVLGGGIVPGSVVLVGGEPGIGKSTLLLQCAARLEQAGIPTLYVSGEEAPHPLRLRADRLADDARGVHVLGETRLEAILHHAKALGSRVVFVDSIQTTYTDQLEGAPGNVGQVRECAARLMRFAKQAGPAVLLVGHVTRGGGIAGPKTLEHIVDTVLYFEGEHTLDHRVLRAVKNRFGSVDEIGVFEMTGGGLLPVADPAATFLAGRVTNTSGSAVTALLEGTRPLLGEIGLGGEVRPVAGVERRLAEAARQGFRRVFCSARSRIAPGAAGVELVALDGIGELARRVAA